MSHEHQHLVKLGTFFDVSFVFGIFLKSSNSLEQFHKLRRAATDVSNIFHFLFFLRIAVDTYDKEVKYQLYRI